MVLLISIVPVFILHPRNESAVSNQMHLGVVGVIISYLFIWMRQKIKQFQNTPAKLNNIILNNNETVSNELETFSRAEALAM